MTIITARLVIAVRCHDRFTSCTFHLHRSLSVAMRLAELTGSTFSTQATLATVSLSSIIMARPFPPLPHTTTISSGCPLGVLANP
jgi:hypothetical protein